MKFFKLLFSKTLVVFLLLVVQFTLILVTNFVFEVYPWFQLISVFLALLMFFYIVNKKECPEFKLPWLVLLFSLPLFAIPFYIIFANPRMPKRAFKRLKTIEDETGKYTAKAAGGDLKSAESGAEKFGYRSDVAEYLENTAAFGAHTHNRVTYYKLGEDFYKDLLIELEKAEKYIFMEYFIVHPGKMWDGIHEILLKKVKCGVEVRLMYDDIGTVGKIPSGYYKELRKEGIDCYKFNTFRPVMSGVHNNRDHRKITVIDGKVGFTGGINLGDEYINEVKPFGQWKDTAIKIEGSAVDNLLALFLQLFDMNAKKNTADYSAYFVAEHEKYDEKGSILPFGDGPKPFYKEQIGENNYINLINAAKRYCYITTPYLIPDFNLTTALRNAAFRGVDVKIITPHIPDKKTIFAMTRSNYSYLLKAGVKIYEYTPGFIHAKMLVADDDLAFVGTINLDYRSLVHHYECGAVMFETPCIKDIKADFEQTLSVSQEKTLENFKMNKIASATNAIMNLFSPML